MLGYPEAWVDSLFHITPNLVLYSQITGDNQYLAEANNKVSIFSENLQDPDTGLFAHAVFDKVDKNYEVPRWDDNKFWARGYSKGLFGEATRAAVIKGAYGLLDKTLRWNWQKTKAKVTGTSIGTNPDPLIYNVIPKKTNVNYGVGAWLILAAEIMD